MDTKRTSLQAVVFDMDDVLYPERQYVHSGYQAVGDYLRQTLGWQDDFAAWLWERFLDGQANGAMDALAVHFSLPAEPSIQRLVQVYREHVPTIRPYGGIPEMLGRLGAMYGLGLLSDGFLPAQRLKLQALGLERLFDAVVFTEEIGRDAWKPSPRGFELIAQRLGAQHRQCAYVADNVSKDFVAPNALGWRTVQFIANGQIYSNVPTPPGGKPAIIARDLEELYRALL